MTVCDHVELFPSGNMIRAARGLVGLEQTELAQQVNVTSKTISSIERDISLRPDERRTKIVRRIRDHLTGRFGIVFLYEDDGQGEGVRLARPRSR